MNYKEQIIEGGKRMLSGGLTVSTFGNLSLLGDDGYVYITPSSMDYRLIKPEDVCVMDLDGNIIDGLRKPSIEHRMHLEIYKARKDIRAIVHTHPIDSTAVSCSGQDLPIIIDECWITLKDIVRVTPYKAPGTDELARAAAEALGKKSKACMLRSHGSVCCGEDLDDAFRVAEVLEMAAKIFIRVQSMNRDYERIQ